jgi:3-deoxy-D-manno-octulosonic-acid transferase
VPIGGHNVLEPASLSTPVVVGTHTFNFEEITVTLINEGGGVRIMAADALGETVRNLLRDGAERERMGLAARYVFERERGAVERVMMLVDRLLDE